MITIERLGVALDGRQVLDDISLAVESASWLCLVGPNGAGKTTLLRTLLGILPYSGSLKANGIERHGDASVNVAFVPQRPEIPAGMTVLEYVTMGRAKRDGWGRETARGRAAVADALDLMKLWGLRDQFVARLSGGEMQRVLIARAVCQEPQLLLLDEPTSALDLHHQVSALNEVESLRASGATIVSTMHDITLAAMYADRFALLSAGRLLVDGTPDAVVHSPQFASLYGNRLRVFTGEDGLPVVLPMRDRLEP